jgi:transposase
MVLTKRRYTSEFKQGAIELTIKLSSIKEAAMELGIPKQTLYQWMCDFKGKGKINNLNPEDTKSTFSLVEENRRLQKELRILREEKEILKKAATYFAQNQQ